MAEDQDKTPPEQEEEEDADALAAEWEAMEAAGAAAEAEPSEGTRVLSQEEIDRLLGQSRQDKQEKRGIRALVNSTSVTYERLPMLEVVLDRLVRHLSTSLRNFTSDNVEVTLIDMYARRFGDYLNAIPLPTMINVFKVKEWDNPAIMAVESPLIYSIVDVLLGGRRITRETRIEGRPYTTIERTLIERFCEVILKDLTISFEPVSHVHFVFDRLETNPRFAMVVRPGNVAIIVKIHIEMEERGGHIEFVIPYSTLEPVREQLLQMFMGEKFGQDTMWETHLATEVWNTEIQARVILDQVSVKLKDILRWTVGSQLILNATTESKVVLRCGDLDLLEGKVGRKNKNVAIQIEKNLLKEEEKL